ncbi:CoA ester lyase [Jannaschia sp. Os4]|uniref:HpcH/HpaI aldolase/citrate lyase family protein n=1 Tax=Jannaschia sp. Os4 TaxID=2807617 RepID=UPI0019399622|nr:CoA ester lyase [Jannaschia sp. Os4]MBM2575103.1 CoA ester lyase [Jannaschia sp. Os4]
MVDRPLRSVLYVPADKPRALEKVRTLPVDAVILDLEDAVAPDAKSTARDAISSALSGNWGDRLVLLRVNAADTPWHADDMAAARAAGCGTPDRPVLLPKVDAAEDVPGDGAFWAMIETPAGVDDVAAIAASCGGLVMGTNDLAKELGTGDDPSRLPLLHALQASVLGARMAGVPIVDGVYNAFRDEDGLRAEAVQGRAWGFDGKSLIHPAQVAVANAVFGPSEAEVDLATRQIEAFEAAQAEGKGVAVLAGRIVENLHVDTARAILAKSAAIAAREG